MPAVDYRRRAAETGQAQLNLPTHRAKPAHLEYRKGTLTGVHSVRIGKNLIDIPDR
jgi:hypothetical protein